MEQDKNEALKVIKNYSYEKGEFCQKSMRKFAYIIFATAWGFLLKEGTSFDEFLLGLTMIWGFCFFFCDVYYSFRFAKRTNRLHEEVLKDKISAIDARDVCNKWSDKTYQALGWQVAFLVLMVANISIYVLRMI